MEGDAKDLPNPSHQEKDPSSQVEEPLGLFVIRYGAHTGRLGLAVRDESCLSETSPHRSQTQVLTMKEMKAEPETPGSEDKAGRYRLTFTMWFGFASTPHKN